MAKVGARKPYGKCCGTHFLCFVSANGDVWECNVFAGDPRFLIGNACQESLKDIWAGSRRKAVLAFIENEMSIAECRDICRMDECNKYLWRLRCPWPHDDFI
jgi:radical SAM protein with 4Fe4S-binding SPASM domain